MVYAGKDAHFTFYEDDGLTYAYEKGQSSRIDLHWNNQTRILTLDERKGSYPGMTKSRTFCVAVIEPDHPLPFDPDNINALCINYDGLTCRIGL
jgi:alpha-D-xyloside xylohydrolase